MSNKEPPALPRSSVSSASQLDLLVETQQFVLQQTHYTALHTKGPVFRQVS